MNTNTGRLILGLLILLILFSTFLYIFNYYSRQNETFTTDPTMVSQHRKALLIPQASGKSGNINGDDKSLETQDTRKITSSLGEIVLYYAMWCGITRQMLPEWEKFEIYAQTNLPYVKVSKVRCEGGNEDVCNQKNIQGFPTIILYIGNNQFMFDNEFNQRTNDNFIKFVQKHLS